MRVCTVCPLSKKIPAKSRAFVRHQRATQLLRVALGGRTNDSLGLIAGIPHACPFREISTAGPRRRRDDRDPITNQPHRVNGDQHVGRPLTAAMLMHSIHLGTRPMP